MHRAFRGCSAASLYVGLVALLAVPVVAGAEQLATSVNGVGCIEEIRVPRYDPLARSAGHQGRVEASLVIGTDGRASEINLKKASISFSPSASRRSLALQD